MAAIGFEFPVDPSGQWDGFNDSAIEHFSGNPFQHLGREVPQNTLDAKAVRPARIRISLKRIAPSEIPDLEGFSDTLKRCSKAAESDGNEKSSKFFQNAQELLKKKQITILQIIDSNTHGVKGPCVNGEPFFALMKATGQSRKSNISTGSYGIGKFAPFTVSELRTVFVSTVWENANGEWQHYVQGKSVLTSHEDDKGEVRRGTGFWGIRKGCMPVETITSDIPDWLRRTKPDGKIDGHAGTTLSVLGFDATKGWEDVLTVNILMNFFGAIKSGELEVVIENGHEINAITLETLLKDASLAKVADEQEGESGRFQTVLSYLQALDAGDGVAVESTENSNLGQCQVRILVGENLPKKVAVLRNGMLITENMPRLKRFGEFKDFVAVLECTSTKGQALLRGMEPPRHDAFEPERLPPDKRQNGRTALREIGDWVRQMLRRHAQDEISEVTNLDEMAEYFGDDEEEGDGKKKDENPGGDIIIRARPIKPKSRPTIYTTSPDAVDDKEDDGPDGPSDSEPNGENEGEGTGGKGSGKQNESSGGDAAGTDGGQGTAPHAGSVSAPVRHVRAVLLEDGTRRRIAFTPMTNGKARVHLQDSGADTNRALRVTSSTMGTVKDGAIEGLILVANERIIFEVQLDDKFVGTVRIVTDAV